MIDQLKEILYRNNPNIEVNLEAANVLKESLIEDYYKNHSEETDNLYSNIKSFILGLALGIVIVYSILR